VGVRVKESNERLVSLFHGFRTQRTFAQSRAEFAAYVVPASEAFGEMLQQVDKD
jgi:hypothetical protein